MKKTFALLIGILITASAAAAAPPSVSRAHAETEADAMVYSVLAPEAYDYLAAIDDLAAARDTVVALSDGTVHVYDNAPGSTTRHSALDAEAVAVAIAGRTPATLDAGGTITVQNAAKSALEVPGAIDFCFAGGYALILTPDRLVRVPYTAAGFDEANVLPDLAVPQGSAVRLAADATTAAVISVANDAGVDTYRLLTIATETAAAEWDAARAIEPCKDVAVVRGGVCRLTEASSTTRITLEKPQADFDLTTGAYHDGHITGAARIAADGDELLIAGSSADVAAVNRYAFSFGETTTFAYVRTELASQDSSSGYFFRPKAAIAYETGTLVADTDNNRVQFLSEAGAQTAVDGLNHPFAVAASGNVLWVADQEGARLGRYRMDSDGWQPELVRTGFGITDLTLRGDDTLWIADRGAIRDADGTAIATEKQVVRLATNGRSTDVFYLAADGDIRQRAADGSEISLGIVAGCVDLDVDAAGKVYALSAESVTVLDRTKRLERPLRPRPHGYESGAATSIALVAGEGHTAPAGSLLIASAAGSVVRLVDAAQTDAAVENWETFAPPVDAWAAEPADDWTPATIETDTYLYLYPSVHSAVRPLPQSTRLFVLSDADELGFFAQVAVEITDESTQRTELVVGYALKDRILASGADAARPFEKGYLLHPSAVYKYPSIAAPKLGDYQKGDEVALLTMPPVTDTAGREWVAVPFGDRVAYLPRQNVLERRETAASIHFRANATVLDDAPLYAKTADGYAAIEGASLAKGTRIMIVGSFDSRAEYAHIRYVDAELGLIDCYLAASAVEPDRLGTVEAVAIALIIITLVIGAVLFCVRKKSTLN